MTEDRPYPHYVYRCYDAEDRLLYIGCTYDVAGRIRQHQDLNYASNPASAYLREHMTRWTSEEYPTRLTARKAEKEAIGAEAPLLNIAHNKGRGLKRVKVAPPTLDEQRAALEALAEVLDMGRNPAA